MLSAYSCTKNLRGKSVSCVPTIFVLFKYLLVVISTINSYWGVRFWIIILYAVYGIRGSHKKPLEKQKCVESFATFWCRQRNWMFSKGKRQSSLVCTCTILNKMQKAHWGLEQWCVCVCAPSSCGDTFEHKQKQPENRLPLQQRRDDCNVCIFSICAWVTHW